MFVLSSFAESATIEVAFPNLTFDKPVDLQHSNDESDRLFVVEQAGRVYVFGNEPNVGEKTLFLDIHDRVAFDQQGGLLGLAFHPNYKNNGYFFVNYTKTNPPTTLVSRFEVMEGSANVDSELTVLEIQQPSILHNNGGQLVFGSDGYLYIAVGDGIEPGDPYGNGQNRQSLLGALLRIDVDNRESGLNYGIPDANPFVDNSSGYREEIYAFGFGNPWRFSFDPVTGWVWLADVGYNTFEEINIVFNGGNYGWNTMEGSQCFNPPIDCDTTGLTMPIWEYHHSVGQSIIGGFVYRGTEVPSLYGDYVYADFNTGTVWSLEYDGINPPENEELVQMGPYSVTSFGLDQNRELYLCSFDGQIYRFIEEDTGSADEGPGGPFQFNLHPNLPNPFNSATLLHYDVPERSEVVLSVYDVLGRKVTTVVRSVEEAGFKSAVWNGRDDYGESVSAGVYLYQLSAKSFTGKDPFTQSRKMVLLR